MQNYDPRQWFWQVGDDESRFWSGSAAAYVTATPSGAGVTRIASESDLADVLRPYGLAGPVATSQDINGERTRRLSRPFTVTITGIGSFPIDMTDQSRANITGLTVLAQLRLAQGATGVMTTFRDADNADHELTPAQAIDIGVQAAAEVDRLYKASWALKAMSPVPADFRDDVYWVADQ